MARYGLRFGAIAPGFVEPILEGMPPEVLKATTSVVPLKRVATDEIFCGIHFIIECGYFTGRCIGIDGGLTL